MDRFLMKYLNNKFTLTFVKVPKSDKGPNDCSFIKKTLIFWDHPFSEKYSNGPGITKKWHISKMTTIGPRICLKVPCVQIWPKKDQKEVSQMANHNLPIGML